MNLTLRTAEKLKAVPPEAWDAAANSDPTTFNPFLSHAFLASLEESGSAAPETGWAPRHLIAEEDGRLVGAMPLYLKSHSYGEYVFDHAWADAYERAGGRYYPKLLSAVPFTPVTGRRLLTRPGPDEGAVRDALLAGAITLARKAHLSSLHINFASEPEWTYLGGKGLLQRQDQQFHWHNRGYQSFEDFLGDLSSRKRKAVRKEREAARASGITFRHVTGRDLTEALWDAFFDFYMDTGSRKWGTPYLTREFFSLIGERMSESVLLVMCERAGRPIAGALNFIGGDCLYGRNWGALEHHPFLHFEACYYQAIDYAIAHRLPRVEAGAQGAHKLARGYMPQPTFSLHWIADPGFARAVANYLEQERAAVRDQIDELSEHGPFRQTLESDRHGL